MKKSKMIIGLCVISIFIVFISFQSVTNAKVAKNNLSEKQVNYIAFFKKLLPSNWHPGYFLSILFAYIMGFFYLWITIHHS